MLWFGSAAVKSPLWCEKLCWGEVLLTEAEINIQLQTAVGSVHVWLVLEMKMFSSHPTVRPKLCRCLTSCPTEKTDLKTVRSEFLGFHCVKRSLWARCLWAKEAAGLRPGWVEWICSGVDLFCFWFSFLPQKRAAQVRF